ncbi:hypothetical protein GCM10009765_71860 [Fodinicola feengrottensis]|uniref:Head decoration protein n=1 Tax=Fodinicola feengrottensis TaxID=435914 RepID=A0ABN2IV13_9ACTN
MLPLSTSTYTVQRPQVLASMSAGLDPYGEGYDLDTSPPHAQAAALYATVSTGVRGHLGSPGGSERDVGGSQENVTFLLALQTTDVTHDDQVLDEADGSRYLVSWVVQRRGLGMAHVQAGVRSVKGLA